MPPNERAKKMENLTALGAIEQAPTRYRTRAATFGRLRKT